MATVSGAHMIIYSANADADRAIPSRCARLPACRCRTGLVDLRAARVGDRHSSCAGERRARNLSDGRRRCGVCRADERPRHSAARRRGIKGWGVLTQLSLPGGGQLGIYEPRHARPKWSAASQADRASRRRRSPRSGGRRVEPRPRARRPSQPREHAVEPGDDARMCVCRIEFWFEAGISNGRRRAGP